MIAGLWGRLKRWMTVTLILRGSISRSDIAALCERTRELLDHGDPEPVFLDIGGLASPDAVTVDALGRLQLVAGRHGRTIRLRHACDELRALIAFVGLEHQLPVAEGLRIQTIGQAEEREQVRGIEEEADGGDAPS